MVAEGLEKGDSLVYLNAAKKAKPIEYEFMDLFEIQYSTAVKKPGFKAPIEKHTLIYDSFGEGLEPIYFWILDRMYEDYKTVDKLVDTFVSAPGSGHFSEMGLKAAKMQEEAMKTLGAANQVIKSILTIIYDLREFKIRLKLYDKYNSEDKKESEEGMLSLKQIWMDTVDLKRGTSAIKGLAQQFDYVTIIDAFMVAKEDAVDKMDLNDRVKRILKQRVSEFFTWVKESEEELRKRFEIEKEYLRSQVNTVKLYARWAKPYLRAAHALEQRATPTAALVNTFNSSLFELVLLGEGVYDPGEDIQTGVLPKVFKDVSQKKFSAIGIVEFKFRTAPERAGQQGYGFRGRVEVTLTSYALSDAEVRVLKRDIEKDDLGDVLSLIEGATERSLSQLTKDIEEFLDEKKEEKKKSESEDSNPFAALFFFMKPLLPEAKKKEKADQYLITIDTDFEQILRSQAIIDARKRCYRVYDLYKKSHKMPSLPGYA